MLILAITCSQMKRLANQVYERVKGTKHEELAKKLKDNSLIVIIILTVLMLVLVWEKVS